MVVDFPEQARQHFDKKANELVNLIESRPLPRRGQRNSDTSIAHKEPVARLKAEDFIGQMIGARGDQFGNETDRFINCEGQGVGFWDEGHTAFEKLIAGLAKRKEIQSFLSKKFLRNTIFTWATGRHFGAAEAQATFTSYLDMQADAAVRDVKVGIPLAHIEIEKSFQIGRVVLDFLRRELFDEMEKALQDQDKARDFPTFRQKFQGVVTAMVDCHCEEDRAIEYAVEETEKALIVLRFFSPGAYLAEAPCYIGRLGIIEVPMGHYVVFENDQSVHFGAQTEERREYVHKIRVEDVREMQKMGLQEFSNLIVADDPTKLETTLLRALELYTRGLISNNVQDRIVLALAAIETLLLRSSTEPIQQSVGQRLAVLIAGDLNARKGVMKAVRDAYTLRSAFLHHGSDKEDLAVLQKLQEHVWDGLRLVTLRRQRYTSHIDLSQALDDQLLG